MINKKIIVNNTYKTILAILIILLMAAPTTAAATGQIKTLSIDQTVILPVPEFIGLSLSTNTITFNIDSLGTIATTPPYNLTNLGNTHIDLSIQAHNDFNGPETLTLTEGFYTLIYQNTTTPITKNSNTIFKTGLNPQRHGTYTIPLYQTFTIPLGTFPGTYNTTITYTAIKTGT